MSLPIPQLRHHRWYVDVEWAVIAVNRALGVTHKDKSIGSDKIHRDTAIRGRHSARRRPVDELGSLTFLVSGALLMQSYRHREAGVAEASYLLFTIPT